jgi:hypothetical protein
MIPVAPPEFKTKAKKPKIRLPLKQVFDIEGAGDFAALIERHFTVLGYRLRDHKDMMWTFARGDWGSQWWNEDIRKWKTELNIAAYERSPSGFRITCYVHTGWDWVDPDQKQLRVLQEELMELESLLGGQPVTLPISEEAA